MTASASGTSFNIRFQSSAKSGTVWFAAPQVEKGETANQFNILMNGDFYAVGIRTFNLRIEKSLLFRPHVRGAYKSAVLPRNPRKHITPKPQKHPKRRTASKAPHPIRPEELLGEILKLIIAPKNPPKPPKAVRIPKNRR